MKMKFFTKKTTDLGKSDESFGWWLSSAMDKVACTISETYDSLGNDSGFGASETKQASEPSSLIQIKQSGDLSDCPTIAIEENLDPNNIEISCADSFQSGALPPEGNIKYRNYRALSPTTVGIRIYSPSGDINTSPKKQKIVPKFDLLQSVSPPRTKIMQLINQNDPGSEELRAIIRPYKDGRRVPGRATPAEEQTPGENSYWNFLQSDACTESPSTISSLSPDIMYTEGLEAQTSKLLMPYYNIKRFLKCTNDTSVYLSEYECDSNEHVPPTYFRRNSFETEPDLAPLSLSEELSIAECNESQKESRKISEFEYSYFHEDLKDSKSPQPYECMDSKTAAIRSYVQWNMIADSSNCDQLARLALTIEEDVEDDKYRDNSFIIAARNMQVRLHDMLKETKQLQENLVDIDKDFQNVMARAEQAEEEARSLMSDVRSMGYLEDVLALMRGEVDRPVMRRKWPFSGCFRRQRDPNVNLIV